MQQQEHGLYLCELPTGNGKTFDSAQAMKEYADSIGDDTKIIYLTTLNKNLPEDALRAAYGSEELYKRNVLRLRSNFDEVVEKILEIEVPEEMKTDAYLKLCKDVSLYRNAVDKRYADKEYIKELADRITEGDRQLRYEITKRLKNKFQTKTQRKKAIRTDAKYKWIGKLYPAVFTDDYKIILMSVSKFMKRNSILIDSSYEFLNSDLIENAVIVIDEFDATKDTIQSELIEKSLAMQEDYIQLFRQIYRTLNPNDFSSSMRQAMDKVEKSGNRNTFTTLMDEARKIAENYHVRLSIKTKEDLVNQRQIFLFNDGSFHTVLEEGAQYIRSSLNKEDNRIDVFFEGKLFYHDPSWRHKDKLTGKVNFIRFLEIVIDPGMYLNLEHKTFKRYDRESNGLYVIDSKTCEFRKKLKTDTNVITYKEGSLPHNHFRVDNFDISDIAHFRKSKMGVMEQFLRDVNDNLSKYMSIDIVEREDAQEFDISNLEKKGISEFEYGEMLQKNGVVIVDDNNSEVSKNIVAKLQEELEKYYHVKAAVGNLSEEAYNIRIIHDGEYYAEKEMHDPHSDNLKGCPKSCRMYKTRAGSSNLMLPAQSLS